MKKLIIFLICLSIISFVISCMPETKVKTPRFSPRGTFYKDTQNVEITCATNGATIYYTTNGSEPNTSSSVYSSPISVTTTTTIKAYAVKEELDDSSIATATYTINEPLYALDFALYNRNSEIVSIYDIGTNYIHLDFSAGWCTYCKQQAAYMDDTEAILTAEGIDIKSVVVLSQDNSGNTAVANILPVVQSWFSSYGLEYILADNSQKTVNAYKEAYWTESSFGFPFNLVLKYNSSSKEYTCIGNWAGAYPSAQGLADKIKQIIASNK